jgi:hypothetical protein
MKEKFIAHITAKFPALKSVDLNPLVSENLLSPFAIELPKSVLHEAERLIASLYRLRENPLYRQSFQEELTARGIKDPGNKSICMSYDFHVTEGPHLKLIEVNTNASFLALGYEMYQLRELPLPQADFQPEELRQNIETELKLQGKEPKKSLNIAIVDETPEQQRLFLEFLVFNEMFKSWGWNSHIFDVRALPKDSVDFIYNRTTDFYLEGAESASLKNAFLTRTSCLSPNPFEYCLLADKQRLIDWHQEGKLESWQVPEEDRKLIRSVVPQSLDVTEAQQAEIWQQRKKFFFKPKRAFGAKQSYRGSSISNKIYAEILGKDFIAQEFVPPKEETFKAPEGPISFKYDLRCYAYQGRLQLVVARLYQGQVTNLNTPLGGFACVVFA